VPLPERRSTRQDLMRLAPELVCVQTRCDYVGHGGAFVSYRS
jgi:hypothetical protein